MLLERKQQSFNPLFVFTRSICQWEGKKNGGLLRLLINVPKAHLLQMQQYLWNDAILCVFGLIL